MVLLVKGDLTLAVRALRHASRGGPRSTAPVNDAGGRLEPDLPPLRAYGRAQVDVLRVHEEALVEQAYGLQIAPAGQQAGTGHPVHLPWLTGHPLDHRGEQGPAPIVAGDE